MFILKRVFTYLGIVFLLIISGMGCNKDKPATSKGDEFFPTGNKIHQLSSEGVICQSPKGKQIKILKEELVKVSIVTNDRGPMEDDMFWVINSKNEECFIFAYENPNLKLLEYFSKFPGFEDGTAFKAFASMSDNKFTLWEKKVKQETSGPVKSGERAEETEPTSAEKKPKRSENN